MTIEEVPGISESNEGVVDGAGTGNDAQREGQGWNEDFGPAVGISDHARIIQFRRSAQKLTRELGALWFGAFLIALLAIGLKLILLAADAFPFNADEAVVGLMARHIWQGAWPAFFYGQAYMGSLDASIAAAGFAAFGQSVFMIRLVQLLLYAGTIVTTVALGWSIYRSRRAAYVAALLLTIPVTNVMLYTTVSLGGYGEALLIGNLLMLLSLRTWWTGKGFVLWGIFAGLGFWAFGLTVVYSLPTGILLIAALWRMNPPGRFVAKLIVTAVGFFLGALPWIVSATGQGLGAFVGELLGEAISGASSASYLMAVRDHLVNFFLFGPTVILGLRPPWAIQGLATPLAPAAVVFWLVVLGFGISRLRLRDRARVGRLLMVAIMVTLLSGFIVTPFGADPSGRYFLPLAVPLALLAGELIALELVPRFGKWAYAALGLVLAFNLWGIFQSAVEQPPGLTTQFDPVAQVDHRALPRLIEFLEAEGELTGYTNYWVAYPLAFLSNEELIFTPRLPYHLDFRYTSRDDRYGPYREIVAQSPSVAYITTNFPELDHRIQEALSLEGIDHQITQIGPYNVIHGLSAPISPHALGIIEQNRDS